MSMKPCRDPRICGVRNHRPGTVCLAERGAPSCGGGVLPAQPPPSSQSTSTSMREFRDVDDLLDAYDKPEREKRPREVVSDSMRRQAFSRLRAGGLVPREAVQAGDALEWEDRDGITQCIYWGSNGYLMYGDSPESEEVRDDHTMRTLTGSADSIDECLPDLRRMKAEAASRSDSDWRTDEEALFSSYVLNAHHEINSTLRSGDHLHPEVERTLDAAMSRDSLAEPLVVFRGVQAHVDIDEGDQSDPGYVSVTDNPHHASSFASRGGKIMMFELPAGTRLRDNRGSEGELVLPRSTPMRGVRIYSKDD